MAEFSARRTPVLPIAPHWRCIANQPLVGTFQRSLWRRPLWDIVPLSQHNTTRSAIAQNSLLTQAPPPAEAVPQVEAAIDATAASDEAYVATNLKLLRNTGLVNALDGCAAALSLLGDKHQYLSFRGPGVAMGVCRKQNLFFGVTLYTYTTPIETLHEDLILAYKAL